MSSKNELFKNVLLDRSAQDLLFREAHTANTFTSEPVTDEQIAALYDLVKWAPTSFNQQPLRVALIRSEEARGESAVLNAALQVAYFILRIRAIGLAAGPMTGFHADKVSEKYFPGGQHRALVVANIDKPGPNAWHERLPRLEYDRVFTSH